MFSISPPLYLRRVSAYWQSQRTRMRKPHGFRGYGAAEPIILYKTSKEFRPKETKDLAINPIFSFSASVSYTT